MSSRRTGAFVGGLTAAALAVLAPLPWSADQLLAVHMAQQMTLLAVSAPLLAYALEPIASRRLRLIARVLAHPMVGLLAFNAALFTWQAPALLDAALQQGALHRLAHFSFLIAAICFWWPIIRPVDVPGGLGPIAKIAYLLIAGVPPTIPGVILALSRAPVYSSGDSAVLGLSRLEDQHLAGLILFATAKFALLAGAFVILWRLLEPVPEPPDDDRDGKAFPDVPPSTPAWLERLEGELPFEPAPERGRAPALHR
jgi:putative membrane protein